jgi:hypothetical protein
LLIAHLVAGIGLLPTVLPLWTKVAVWLGLVISFAAVVRRRIPARLILHTDGRLTIERDRDADTIDGDVHPATVVWPWLVVLVFKSPSGVGAMTLPPDALGDEEHRQLRVWLKWKANGGVV